RPAEGHRVTTPAEAHRVRPGALDLDRQGEGVELREGQLREVDLASGEPVRRVRRDPDLLFEAGGSGQLVEAGRLGGEIPGDQDPARHRVVLPDAHLRVELETPGEDEQHGDHGGDAQQPSGRAGAAGGRGVRCGAELGHGTHSARARALRRVDVPSRRATSPATVRPLAPITPPPGWVEAPARNTPSAPGTAWPCRSGWGRMGSIWSSDISTCITFPPISPSSVSRSSGVWT